MTLSTTQPHQSLGRRKVMNRFVKRLVVISIVTALTIWGVVSLKNAADEFGHYIADSIVVKTK